MHIMRLCALLLLCEQVCQCCEVAGTDFTHVKKLLLLACCFQFLQSGLDLVFFFNNVLIKKFKAIKHTPYLLFSLADMTGSFYINSSYLLVNSVCNK